MDSPRRLDGPPRLTDPKKKTSPAQGGWCSIGLGAGTILTGIRPCSVIPKSTETNTVLSRILEDGKKNPGVLAGTRGTATNGSGYMEHSIKLIDRFWAKVEKTEACWNWTASKMTNGYGQVWFGDEKLLSHRASYILANGPIPDGMHVDHICHNRGCVNPEHLRLTTAKQNGEHRVGAPSNSVSGIRGVRWRERDKRWTAHVTHNGKQHHVGTFLSAEDAQSAVIAKRNELFTHNNLDRAA